MRLRETYTVIILHVAELSLVASFPCLTIASLLRGIPVTLTRITALI